MKLRMWLLEYKQMTYAEYKGLDEFDQEDLLQEHRDFCRKEQIHNSLNWRPATEEEKRRLHAVLEKEKKRYETNLGIGGIDRRGNYTALHYRHN